VLLISEMKIEGFRCFQSFSMKAMRPVTILGGPNNVGKSSVLEALLLPMVVSTPGYFMWLANMRNGADSVQPQPRFVWTPLFNRVSEANTLHVSLTNETGEATILQLRKEMGAAAVNRGNLGGRVDNLVALHLTYEHAEERVEGKYVFVSEARRPYDAIESHIAFIPYTENPPASDDLMNVFYYKEGRDFSNAQVAEWVSQASMQVKQKSQLLQLLQIFDSGIADIMTVLDTGQPYVYIIKANGTQLPLRHMGDGINKAIRLLLAVMHASDGILLIDEVENGLYYSLYDKVLDALYRAAMQLHCQLIITTHNQQILQSSVDVMLNAGMLQQLSYQRLEQYRDDIRAYAFSGEDLDLAIQADLEVR